MICEKTNKGQCLFGGVLVSENRTQPNRTKRSVRTVSYYSINTLGQAGCVKYPNCFHQHNFSSNFMLFVFIDIVSDGEIEHSNYMFFNNLVSLTFKKQPPPFFLHGFLSAINIFVFNHLNSISRPIQTANLLYYQSYSLMKSFLPNGIAPSLDRANSEHSVL
jgi:hypothetical protein